MTGYSNEAESKANEELAERSARLGLFLYQYAYNHWAWFRELSDWAVLAWDTVEAKGVEWIHLYAQWARRLDSPWRELMLFGLPATAMCVILVSAIADSSRRRKERKEPCNA